MDLTVYLTPVEIKMAKQRQRVHQLLQKGYGVRQIARQEKISSRTVINIKKYLGIKVTNRQTAADFLASGESAKKSKIPWQLG